MRKEYLNLIVCHHCKTQFNDGDAIYTIASRKFDDKSKQFLQDTTAMSIETAWGWVDVPSVERTLNFHSKCFEEVAGEDYLP